MWGSLIKISLLLVLAVVLAGCAGTRVGAKSVTRAVTEDGRIYKANVETVKGLSGAALAKLKEGALGAYTEVNEDGTWMVDLNGEALEADGTAFSADLVTLAETIGTFLPAGQVAELAAMATDGATGTSIGERLADMLNGSE